MKFLGMISGEELLISYNLNQIDTYADTSGVVQMIHRNFWMTGLFMALQTRLIACGKSTQILNPLSGYEESMYVMTGTLPLNSCAIL